MEKTWTTWTFKVCSASVSGGAVVKVLNATTWGKAPMSLPTPTDNCFHLALGSGGRNIVENDNGLHHQVRCFDYF